MRIPKVYYFKKDSDKIPYQIKETITVDEMMASINNNIYRKTNPDLPELTVGQQVENIIYPYAYFRYKKQIWPIYDDDAGQQSYIVINGETFGAGAYTVYPYDVMYFTYEIDNQGKN